MNAIIFLLSLIEQKELVKSLSCAHSAHWICKNDMYTVMFGYMYINFIFDLELGLSPKVCLQRASFYF